MRGLWFYSCFCSGAVFTVGVYASRICGDVALLQALHEGRLLLCVAAAAAAAGWLLLLVPAANGSLLLFQ